MTQCPATTTVAHYQTLPHPADRDAIRYTDDAHCHVVELHTLHRANVQPELAGPVIEVTWRTDLPGPTLEQVVTADRDKMAERRRLESYVDAKIAEIVRYRPADEPVRNPNADIIGREERRRWCLSQTPMHPGLTGEQIIARATKYETWLTR